MKISLYTIEPPSGRCVLLVHELLKATDLGGDASIGMAQRLFDGQHLRDRPAIITIPESKSTDRPGFLCKEVGIVVEIAEP